MAKLVTFLCRSCGQQLRAPWERLGEHGKCPRCGQPLSVPRWYPAQVSAVLKDWRAALARRLASGRGEDRPVDGHGDTRRRFPRFPTPGWEALKRSPGRRLIMTAALGLGVVAVLLLRTPTGFRRSNPVDPVTVDPVRVAVEAGTRFTAPPPVPSLAPTLTAIPVPDFTGAMAVWGSTGVDSAGHVWFGVSAIDWKEGHQGAIPNLSAHLFEFRPETREVFDRGNPISQLKQAGLLREGERQQKIHTKIVQAPDGYLYFASGDEQGASLSGSLKLPDWGSHLWRKKPASERWEHLMTVPEHLIAVAGGGPHIFALGWHGHVLYAYDTRTGLIETVRVGSVRGHISRNLLADDRGHVYVPRLRFTIETPSRLVVTLVEFTPDLREVGQTPLDHYLAEEIHLQHGITGVQTLADRSIAFVTAEGYLYRVTPGASGPAEVTELGWFDPEGRNYVATLFTYDGHRSLVGVSSRDGVDRWLVFDLSTRTSTAMPLPKRAGVMVLAGASRPQHAPIEVGNGTALYGCSTRDDEGNFYLVGRRGYDPVVLQARPPVGAGELLSSGPAFAPVADDYLPAASARARAGTPAGVSPEPSGGPDPLGGVGTELQPALGADPGQRRLQFHKELKILLEAGDNNAGPAIRELCNRYGRELPPEARNASGVLSRTKFIELDMKHPINVYRRAGVPETVILDNLFRLQAAAITSSGGPRDQDEALTRAARLLLSIPPPDVRK